MASPPVLATDLKNLHRLYANSEYQQLSQEFLLAFEHFTNVVYLNENSVRTTLTPFLTTFLTLFTRSDFVIPEDHAERYVQQNVLIANLAAITPFRTTDPFLELIRHQPSNFVKVLTLYSARNTCRFDRQEFFQAEPKIASLWYNLFCEIYKSGLGREDVVRHLIEHFQQRSEHMVSGAGITEPYFGSTYVDGSIDREIKPLLNSVLRSSKPLSDRKRNPRKIAVMSDNWSHNHSSYRILYHLLKELKGHYHLTLIHILSEKKDIDTSLFDEVHQLEVREGQMIIDRLIDNDYQAVYFPDIGMNQPSVMLANFRIAPLQFCTPGQSVSTWGADVDYFVSGQAIEESHQPERHYSERLVLLPGMGIVHNRPDFELTGSRKDVPEIVVNCPWSGHKIHYRFLATLRKLIDRVQTPIRLRLFPGVGISQNNGHLAFLNDLHAALGDRMLIEVRTQLPYRDYMTYLEQGDLTLDSYHFGGCNSVADSLFVRKPTVVWEGDKWYNRIGPAMLRVVGLSELIATNEEEYLEKSLSLIHDSAKRRSLSERLQKTDLDATLFSTREAPAFRRAVDQMIAHHDEWKRQGSRKPIVID